MVTEFELENNFQHIKTAVIIAIFLGLATSVFFLAIEKESYSAIYILPDSIIQNPDDNTVFYAYGITSSENKKMDYTLDTYAGEELIKTKQFSLNPGETLEEKVKTILPAESHHPEKITLTLKTNITSESVHFWVNDIIL